mmetsp:Transcript_34147/g.89800  ORF Transcript_34147/g.89800 Transcript_34147/m.89800 type:complete len:297 (+) Transcript_34147:509-1399(+)
MATPTAPSASSASISDKPLTPAAPVVQLALDEAAKAKAKAAEAARLAAEPVTLPATPAFNTLGEQLRDTFHPFSPPAELLIPVKLEVDGSKLVPPVEQHFSETVLWNAHEAASNVDAFAKLTRVEVGLPAVFDEQIAAQIKRAASEALATIPSATNSGDQGVITLDLHVSHPSGVELHDRVLWDTSCTTPTPEEFARQLCSDLNITELEGAVALAVREQLLAIRASAVETVPPTTPADEISVVRSERDALEWSPFISVAGTSAEIEHTEWLKAEAKESERRDRLRRRAAGSGGTDD